MIRWSCPTISGVVSGHKENKIEKAGIQVSRSRFVNAPIIEKYPLILECKVIEMQEALGEMHVVGEVVNVLADDTVLDGQGKVDLDSYNQFHMIQLLIPIVCWGKNSR